jgi:hypothetical protein
MTDKSPKAALLRLLAAAQDQQACDDLAIVVHAFEKLKLAAADMLALVDNITSADFALGGDKVERDALRDVLAQMNDDA